LPGNLSSIFCPPIIASFPKRRVVYERNNGRKELMVHLRLNLIQLDFRPSGDVLQLFHSLA